MLRTVAIIQARMTSTRLPGKVLADLAGDPMLARVVRRVQRANSLDDVVIATTTEPIDDVIVALCEQSGWPHFRGKREDVLDRYLEAAVKYRAKVIVRITADCPLIEPSIVDRTVEAFRYHAPVDYASNGLPPLSFPRGLDVEVIALGALERAWREDTNPAWREHVTPYIYRHPELFRLQSVVNPVDRSDMRWTVDTPEDLALVRSIYQHFGHDRFSWEEVIALLEKHAEWASVNKHVRQKTVPGARSREELA